MDNLQNDFSKNLNQPNTINNPKIAFMTKFKGFGCVGFFIFSGIIAFVINQMFNHNNREKTVEKNTNIELPNATREDFVGATLSDKGVLVWVIYEKKGRSGFIQYTNIDKKTPPKEVFLMDNITDVFELKNAIYVVGGKNSDEVDVRDATTGERLFNEEFLVQKYPELSAGIGEIKLFEGKGFEVITKKGDQFYYLFVNQKLYSAAQKKELATNYSDKNGFVAEYLWYTQGKETIKKTYFMAKTIRNPFYIDPKATNNIVPIAEILMEENEGKSSEEFEKFPTTTKTFLQGNLVYGDQEYAIIAHASAIGAGNHTIYTGIEAKTGKILWEKVSEKNLLFNSGSESTHSNHWEISKKSRYNDLVLFYRKAGTPSFLIIELKTGKIIVEKNNLF